MQRPEINNTHTRTLTATEQYAQPRQARLVALGCTLALIACTLVGCSSTTQRSKASYQQS